uniref:HTH CENPB-type domain-containing protein n=1 Tax=Cacopsylla melanoneura TaxID=428564 RepID=A0A8D8QDA8_9HEMI
MSAVERPKLSPEILALAANEVKSGAKLMTTAKKYNISRNTLRYHVVTPAPRQRVGAKCVLPEQNELAIANWLKECANRKGHTLTKNEIAKAVQTYVRKFNLTTPFIDDKPGRRWLELFVKRRPQAIPGIAGNEDVFCGSVNVSEDSVEVVLGKTEQVSSGDGESGEEDSSNEEDNQGEESSGHWSWNGDVQLCLHGLLCNATRLKPRHFPRNPQRQTLRPTRGPPLPLHQEELLRSHLLAV